MSLNKILETFDHTENIRYNDDEESFEPIKLPKSYEDIPVFNIDGLAKHEKLTIDQIIEYYNEIIEGDVRVSFINGLETRLDMGYYYCDYCRTELFGRNGERDNYYYCKTCKIDMCSLCFEEKTEEIAVKNGAKNYAERKEALQNCFNNHILEHRDTTNMPTYSNYRVCDYCKSSIDSGTYYSNKQTDKDMCTKCYDSSEENKKICQTEKLEFVDNSKTQNFDYFGWGSLFDWIPIIKDDEYNMVTINCNPDSKLFGKVGLVSVDDHGRQGYDYCEMTLDEVISKLRTYKNEHEGSGGWDEVYNYPIKQFMHDHNMKYHYG